MLYQAHLTFDRHGMSGPEMVRLIFLVDRENPDDAVKALRSELLRVRREGELFEDDLGEISVYLDEMVEVRRMPKRGFIARYESATGDQVARVMSACPGRPRGCQVFGWTDADEGEPDEDGAREGTLRPFLVLPERG